MSVTLNLPPAADQALRRAWGDQLDRKAFEALLIEGYRERKISVGRLAELLGLPTSHDADNWLSERGVDRNYDFTDFQHDCAALDCLHSPEKS
jgi:predicted HTH domain antitoxin